MAEPKPSNDPVVAMLTKLRGRIEKMETASGTQRANLRAEVMKLFDDLEAQVQQQITENSYTKTEIDSRIANPPNVTVAGTLAAPQAAVTNWPSYGTAVWNKAAGTNGELGLIPSIRSAKQDIVPAPVDEAAFRSVEAVLFRYRNDVAERGTEARVDRGFIADDMQAAGFTEALYFDADGVLAGLNYDRLTPILWEVTKQLLDDRDNLTARVSALENGV